MRKYSIMACAIAGALLGAPVAAKAPATWDGLVSVKAKRFDLVYLQPGADFRAYAKVLIDPTEVSFHKDWQRDYNRSNRMLAGRISDSDMQEAITKGVAAAHDIFVSAWTKGGYAIAGAPGPDVLRVTTGIMNIQVNAPEKMTAGRSYSFAPEAGQATFFLEVRDSQTNALLGRVVDQKIVGDTAALQRTSVSNRADFRYQVERWADASVRGLNTLKSMSPIHP